MAHRDVDPITKAPIELVGLVRGEVLQGVLQALDSMTGAPPGLYLDPIINLQLPALELLAEDGADIQASASINADTTTNVWTCPDDYRYEVQSIYAVRTSGGRNITQILYLPRGGSTYLTLVTFTGASEYTLLMGSKFTVSPGDRFALITSGGTANATVYSFRVKYLRFPLYAGTPWHSSVS